MVTLIVLVLLNQGDARFPGAIPATPLKSHPEKVSPEPSALACSIDTLRKSQQCVFDGRPASVDDSAEAHRKQGAANAELALKVAQGLCVERLPPSLDAKEKKRRLAACLEGTRRAATECTLKGAEFLLDVEGRFSKLARNCYAELATALQSAEVPPAPKGAEVTTNSPTTQ